MLLKLSNLDANETAFFSRELEQVKSRTYETVYPELLARQLVPASPEPADSGAAWFTYGMFDRVGMAKLISDYADDLPRVDVVGTQFTAPIKSLGASYGYSLQEVRASALANRSLPQLRANAARRAIEEKIDDIIAVGKTDAGLYGFVNNPNVPVTSVATEGGATTWADKADPASSPDYIVADLNAVLSAIISTTHGRESPDTIVLPTSGFVTISTTRLHDQPVTVLDFVRKSFPQITNIVHWPKLNGAGAGGTDRMVVYKKDPSKLFYEVPQEFEALSVQERNLEFVVPCHARVGGTVFTHPLSAAYVDGL